jgi:uncharacterized protein (TIGR02246 family)
MNRMPMLLMFLVIAAHAEAAGIRRVKLSEEAVHRRYAEFAAAWNRNDPERMASFWADDGDHFATDGRVARGREEVRSLFADQLSTIFEGSKLTLTVESIQFIRPDVVIVNGDYEIVGAHLPDGTSLPPIRGLHTDVWIERDAKWQLIASRPMVPGPLRVRAD